MGAGGCSSRSYVVPFYSDSRCERVHAREDYQFTSGLCGSVPHSHLCLFAIISTLLQISTGSFSMRVIISEHMLLCSADILLKSFLNLQICQD